MRNDKCNQANSGISRLDSLQWYFSFLIYNFSFVCCLIFVFVVFVTAMSICKRSLQSLIMSLYTAGDNRFVSLSRSNQYSVSAHSFKDIVAFTRNSFLLTEYWASLKFAPIDVPERNNCLARVNSCFSSHKYLYRLYILIANLRLFSKAVFILLNDTKIGKE